MDGKGKITDLIINDLEDEGTAVTRRNVFPIVQVLQRNLKRVTAGARVRVDLNSR